MRVTEGDVKGDSFVRVSEGWKWSLKKAKGERVVLGQLTLLSDPVSLTSAAVFLQHKTCELEKIKVSIEECQWLWLLLLGEGRTTRVLKQKDNAP